MTLPKKPVEVVVTELKVSARSVARLADCLIEEYTKCGPVSDNFETADPISISLIPVASDANIFLELSLRVILLKLFPQLDSS